MIRNIFIILSVMIISSGALGASIYAKRANQTKSLYADDTARSVGDLLTILIEEDHKTDNSVSRELQNETSRRSDFDGNIGFTEDSELQLLGFRMDATAERELEGQSDYSDERSIEDRITVVVEDILENGNLVLIGTRQRDIAGDKQIISVSGIVRPSDISFDNTVSSGKIANFTLLTVNDGVSEQYNEQGWLGRIFDVIWPL